MTTKIERERLLGLAAYEPTARLRDGAPCTDAESYGRFVAASATDDYWFSLARELPWSERPSAARRDDVWFPGGKLNLGQGVLERMAAAPLVEVDRSGRLRRVSRDELQCRAAELSSRLAEVGLEPGQRICIASSSCAGFVAALIAAWHRGVVVVPGDLARDAEGFARRARETGCRFVLASSATITGDEGHSAYAPAVGDVPSLAWEDPAAVRRESLRPEAPPLEGRHPAVVLANSAGQSFTIGAAGLALSGVSALRHIADGRGAGDTILLAGPAHHSSFVSLTVGALLAGQTVALVDGASCAGLEGLHGAAVATQSRVVVASGGLLARLAGGAVDSRERRGLSGPALFVVEGESVEPRLVEWLRNGFYDGATHVVQALSRPEAGGFIAGPGASSLPVRPGSVSLPAPGLAVIVVDSKGGRCLLGEGGLLAVERPAPGLAAEFASGAPPFVIGVRARADRNGWLWVMGEVRVEHSERERVPLAELEAVIAAVPGVEQAAVVRYPDPDGVTRTRAFVAAPAGDTLLEPLRAAVTARLGERALPDSFQFVARLPHSRSGKLLRSVLRRVSTGEVEGLEEVSLVTEPDVVRELVEGRERLRTQAPDGA